MLHLLETDQENNIDYIAYFNLDVDIVELEF